MVEENRVSYTDRTMQHPFIYSQRMNNFPLKKGSKLVTSDEFVSEQ